MMKIEIAKTYSASPAGRFRNDGPFSGERFRDEILLPALKDGKKVAVVLDGTAGYGSSFLEEAFGGLVRAGLTKAQLDAQLEIIANSGEYKRYRESALQYIADAENARL